MRQRWEILAELTKQIDARVAVEVGVSRGICSSNWIALCPNLVTCYLVDRDSSVWDIGQYQDRNVVHKIKYVKSESLEAAKTIHNELDLVYIDADHGYQAVKDDIKAWMPKIRKGGIICGHDYTLQNNIHTEVNLAVNELFTPQQLHLEADLLDNASLYIWWVQL